MEWSESALLIHTRPLGESKVIATLLTENRGKAAGLFRVTRGNRAWLQAGAFVKATWRARIETQLGTWQLEPYSTAASQLFDHPSRLAALSSACSLCHLLLPEGHAYPQLYAALHEVVDGLTCENWLKTYVSFEYVLLQELGYGLDVSACAVTGQVEGLVAVSPKTGRAVCQEVAAPYAHKLLPLPAFLVKDAEACLQDLTDGLHLTGYFLERYALTPLKGGLPAARGRLVSYVKSRVD